MKRRLLLTLLGLMACAMSSNSASAAAVPGAGAIGTIDQTGTLVQKIHGCHSSPAIGPEVGECHVHYGAACYYEVIPMYHCRRGYRSRDYYEPRRRSHRPRCWTDCHYRGPIKVCRRVCR